MNLPNDENLPVRVVEHEKMKANTEYDPNCCVRNDSNENEIEHSDEDIWHDTKENDDEYGEESTFYNSRMWAGDCSFDEHNKADLIANDPINAHFIETKIYESRQRSIQRSDVRTD